MPCMNSEKIMAPSISNMYKTDITQKCNGLHQNYVDITKIRRHKNAIGVNMWTSTLNADLLLNINTNIITLLM